MVSYPPNFVSKVAEEQWNAGFKAGVQEVLHTFSTEELLDASEKGAPNEQWAKAFIEKLSKKYL